MQFINFSNSLPNIPVAPHFIQSKSRSPCWGYEVLHDQLPSFPITSLTLSPLTHSSPASPTSSDTQGILPHHVFCSCYSLCAEFALTSSRPRLKWLRCLLLSRIYHSYHSQMVVLALGTPISLSCRFFSINITSSKILHNLLINFEYKLQEGWVVIYVHYSIRTAWSSACWEH